MDDGLKRAREALVRHHVAVENEGDADAVIATFAVPRYDIVATGTVFNGPEAVRERVAGMAAALPACRVEIVRLHHADDAVIVETRARGPHRGMLFGIPANDQPIDIKGVAIFRFDGEGLIEEVVYYDRLTIREQIA